MTVRSTASAVVVLVFAATAALAMSSKPSSPPPQPTQPGMPEIADPSRAQASTRQAAEQSYALAYEEVGKAKKDIEDGKGKKAEKKFQHALERCEKAVLLDERYHEAWNLLGYTARKLGDYDKAFKAYDRCLMIKPDYAPAREYLGEAWLEKGDAKQARLQLVWLERLGATEELKALKAHYDAWAAAHPDSAATPLSTSAPTDSATAAAPGASGP
jgi:tetratricopeptide (TPR) repeat protein